MLRPVFCRRATQIVVSSLLGSVASRVQPKALVAYSSTHCWRTHTCGELRKRHVGDKVTLCGWVEFSRSKKFLVLRDWQGQVQVLLSKKIAKNISIESVIKVIGTVQSRPDKDINHELESGHVEVHAEDVEVLNHCKSLPFRLNEFAKKGEDVRMTYRYLDIRTESMQNRLRLRSNLISLMREFLIHNHNFVEVETPTLICPTPGGAREFLVPSSVDQGQFYSLPQSPQQFKQLLMVGGVDRYFQVAKCYRDEGAKPDRQPEFTQLDMEMSFVSMEDIMHITENMIRISWPYDLGDDPFPKMTYADTVDKYGTDKPDLRLGMQITDVTSFFESGVEEAVNCLVIPKKYVQYCSEPIAQEMQSELTNLLETSYAHNGIFFVQNNEIKLMSGEDLYTLSNISLPQKLGLTENDILWLSWGKKSNVKLTLGKAMHVIRDMLISKAGNLWNNEFRFAWIYDFPLFEEGSDKKLCCVHHPFTAPLPNDTGLLETNPLAVRSLAYDLVLNGSEVAGGSIRIHTADLQRRILKDFLNIDPTALEHLLQALDHGAPPHGGIAIGLDRILAVLCGADSIRDVIAFPKSSLGRDMMCNAPRRVDKETLSHFFA